MTKKFHTLLDGMSRQRRDRINAKTRKMIMLDRCLRAFFFFLIVCVLIIFWVDTMAESLSCKFIIDEPYKVKVGWSSVLQTRYKKVFIGPYPATLEQLRAVDRGASVIIKFDDKFIKIPKKASYSCI